MAANSRLSIMMHCLRTSLCRASLLAVAVGLLPSASFADTKICGDGTVVPVNINNAAGWVLLEDCWLNLTSNSDCKVTASADIDNPGGANAQNRYRFTVAVDGALPPANDIFERTATVPNNAGAPYTDEVSTVGVFYGLQPGLHVFASFGRKRSVLTTAALADDSSLGVVCVDEDHNRPPDQDPGDDAAE